jgi:hypothetical protein
MQGLFWGLAVANRDSRLIPFARSATMIMQETRDSQALDAGCGI